MNRYRMTLTAIIYESRDYEVEADTEDHAWMRGERLLEQELPNLDHVRQDEIELISDDAEPVAIIDPLNRLLNAATTAASELTALSADDHPWWADPSVLRSEYAAMAQTLRDTIEAARSIPEPPDALTQARELIDRLLDAADHGATELDSLSVDAQEDHDAGITREVSAADYERRAKTAWQAIEDARKFLASGPPTT